MKTGQYFFVKTVKCAGCGNRRKYDGPGLRMKYHPAANWKLLLACSADCAGKFVKKNQDQPKKEIGASKAPEPEMLMTRYGAIPYRNVQPGKI